MKAVKIFIEKFHSNVGLLQMVKDVKIHFGMGLKEAKDHIDAIGNLVQTEIIIGEGTEQYNVLMYLQEMDYITIGVKAKTKLVEVKVKPERKRVVAKLTKEQEHALAWAKSLHPKKRAMINLLIKNTDGI